MRRKTQLRVLSGLLVLILIFSVALWQRPALYDWWQLRHYQPTAAITQLADDTTMTSAARHLFFVNHAVIQDKAAFNQACPNDGGEQTIILGCYHGRESGIFIYGVDDATLNGVEQVTAAHEMLHAAYERLSNHDRQRIDDLLNNFYHHDLHDQRLLDTIAAYQKSEPDDVTNEMHSVFGTEVRNLPPELEQYYQRYFSNRAQIVGFSENYEGVFTKQKQQLQDIEGQIISLRSQIDALEQTLTQARNDLDAQRAQLSTNATAGQVAAFNSKVASFNAQVNQLNDLVARHNQLVAQYKNQALQAQKLFNEIDSRQSPVQKQ